MKKFIGLLFTLTLLLMAQISAGQDKTLDQPLSKKTNGSSLKSFKSECKQAISNPDRKLITLLDNVTINTDKLKVENASKATYDQSSNKLTVYDCKKLSFQGEIVLSSDKKFENIIEYTIGDNKVLIR